MLERTDATANKVLEPITFVLVYPTAYNIGYITAIYIAPRTLNHFNHNYYMFVCLFSWRYNPFCLYFSQPGSGL